MCVDNQNFATLLGHNFVGYWFVALQFNMIHYMHWVIHSWGHKSVGKSNS